MWYVIHTKTGVEHELSKTLRDSLSEQWCRGCLVPTYEDVRRTGDVSRISYRKLFPGYVLVDSDFPEKIVGELGEVHQYARMLGHERLEINGRDDGMGSFLPVSDDDMDFLHSILEDGVMRVSYVERVHGNRAGRIIGPLAKYGNHIHTLEFRKRRAIVEADVFGRKRKIRFGLWTDKDPKIPWIEERKRRPEKTEYLLSDTDIGIHAGDKVVDVTGTYGDEVFVVESVNPNKRVFTTKIMMFGEPRYTEMFVDQVEKRPE